MKSALSCHRDTVSSRFEPSHRQNRQYDAPTPAAVNYMLAPSRAEVEVYTRWPDPSMDLQDTPRHVRGERIISSKSARTVATLEHPAVAWYHDQWHFVIGDETGPVPRWRNRMTNVTRCYDTSRVLLWSAALWMLVPSAIFAGESPTIGTNVGQMYPDFRLPKLDGTFGRLSDYRGKKVLLIHFASW